jgi:hypothetical protein
VRSRLYTLYAPLGVAVAVGAAFFYAAANGLIWP